MTPAEFAAAMQSIALRANDDGDLEHEHAQGDDLMERVLTDLGYGEGVRIFREMDKWYA